MGTAEQGQAARPKERRRPRGRVAWAMLLALGVGSGIVVTGGAEAEAEPARTLLILGDSYSSGEGLAPYTRGSDEPDNRCHRSDKAYGARAASELGFDVVNRACSGAVIEDMWRDDPDNAGEIAQMRGTEALGAQDAIAMTIGGNDAGWVELLTSCAIVDLPAGQRYAPDLSDCQRRKDDRAATVDRVVGRLGPLYRAILDSTPAQVNVLLYPPMMPVRSPDATADCRLQRLFPVGDVAVSADTSRRVVEMQILFNDRVRETVERIGNPRLRVVDTVEAFGGYEGHTVSCGIGNRPTPWINAARVDAWHFTGPGQLTDPGAGRDRLVRHRLLGDGAFHPTEAGHDAMADAVIAATRS
jgi:lysophospholipase L1-like esterase